jgi:SAM-dependent methyltransferase
LEEQTFEDAKFDIVITQDVFEHIYNPGKAFMEIARTLKHGGAHIFTVPILNKFKQTEVWAKQDNKGNPVFLKIEEYHHNPVDKKGSPVTMHWGFDIVNFIREHSGLETIIEIEYVNPINYGIWGENLEVLVSRKK